MLISGRIVVSFVMFAIFAVSASVLTGNPLWDALGTIAIGVLLIVIAIFIAIEVKQLLLGQSIDPHDLRRIKAFLGERDEVEKVYNTITIQFGPDVMVAVKA